ncbi:MAG: glycosyl transferase group 1 [Rhodospirillales bacterium]|jgi:glycosyltransferase involved in cell wall biosynthesis|nr:glycosyl transferase group 1 [Rhodospirillales bacterium]
MVLPRLDREGRFIGPVGFRLKWRLLSAARCLLVPSLAPETSSLVAMEALACGTPVIAFANGALPEIIEHGRTGFIVSDVGGMAAAIWDSARISAEACRDAARRRFYASMMVRRYLALYQTLAGRSEADLISLGMDS